jgi:hypothetical protein
MCVIAWLVDALIMRMSEAMEESADPGISFQENCRKWSNYSNHPKNAFQVFLQHLQLHQQQLMHEEVIMSL